MAQLKSTTINGDLKIYGTLSLQNPIIKSKRIHKDSPTITNSYGGETFSVHEEGYKPLGVIGWSFLTTYFAPVELHLDTTEETLTYTVRRFYSESVNSGIDYGVYFNILYININLI